MHCFLLQDWVTLSIAASGMGPPPFTLTQGEADWRDLEGYQDVIAWVDLRQVTISNPNNLVLDFQTAATKDEQLFVSLVVNQLLTGGSGISLTSSSASFSPLVVRMTKDTSAAPLFKWLRWRLTGSANAAGTVTMRIWVAANYPIGSTSEAPCNCAKRPSRVAQPRTP
jgi:hypothetical protein